MEGAAHGGEGVEGEGGGGGGVVVPAVAHGVVVVGGAVDVVGEGGGAGVGGELLDVCVETDGGDDVVCGEGLAEDEGVEVGVGLGDDGVEDDGAGDEEAGGGEGEEGGGVCFDVGGCVGDLGEELGDQGGELALDVVDLDLRAGGDVFGEQGSEEGWGC